MKLKNLTLALIALLLCGCNKSDEPSGQDPEPQKELSSFSLFGNITVGGFVGGENLEHETQLVKFEKYIKSNNTVVTGVNAVNCHVQSDGDEGVYLIVGSQGTSGNISFSFNIPVAKIELTLACWSKYYNDSWHPEVAGACAKLGNAYTSFELYADSDGKPIPVTKELETKSTNEEDYKAVSIMREVSPKYDGYRTEIREMVVYYYAD